ncbi:putative oxidoreductase YrpG [Spirochaetia bacterium]|nr:putative oxidoreductase YrpG [Spirochaetia bacterium]
MQYAYLGRTGMKVSRICLGTGAFGGGGNGYGNWGSVVEKDAHYLMDMALEAGINFFDSADAYGGHGEGGYCGLSEAIVGTWFARGGGRRERTVISTKSGHLVKEYTWDGPNQMPNISLYKIRRHFKESLKRLQTDHVELYLMHDIAQRTTWDEVWEAYESLVRSEQVDYIGSSNGSAWEIMKANEVAHRRNFMGIVNEQHVYSPLIRQPELEILPMALDQGIGITIFSPLYRGVLGLDLLEPEKRPLSDEARRVVEKYRPQLTEYAKVCHDIKEPVGAVTVAWQLAHPAISSVIIGPCTPEDLKELIHAADIVLDRETMNRIDKIFPGPGGAAPWAYEGWGELNKR